MRTEADKVVSIFSSLFLAHLTVFYKAPVMGLELLLSPRGLSLLRCQRSLQEHKEIGMPDISYVIDICYEVF